MMMPGQTVLLCLLLLSKPLLMAVQGNQVHTPAKVTWQLIDGLSSQVLNQTSSVQPPSTWWPDLYFCFRDISPVYAATPALQARQYGFYACPSTSNFQECGGLKSGYCAKWNCVTSIDGDWRWSVTKPDLVSFSFATTYMLEPYRTNLYGGRPYINLSLGVYPSDNPRCAPTSLDAVKVSFTQQGKKVSEWLTDKTWGLRFYSGSHPISTLIIRRTVESVSTQGIGPDPIINIANIQRNSSFPFQVSKDP